MLFQLGYVSTAANEMSREGLIAILEVARRINRGHGLTGLLLFHAGSFLQVLEGEQDAVRETYARISADRRHTDLQLLFEEAITERQFADWSMGFQALDGNELLEFPRADGSTPDLRSMADDIGKTRRFMQLLRSRGLDPAKDVVTPG